MAVSMHIAEGQCLAVHLHVKLDRDARRRSKFSSIVVTLFSQLAVPCRTNEGVIMSILRGRVYLGSMHIAEGQCRGAFTRKAR